MTNSEWWMTHDWGSFNRLLRATKRNYKGGLVRTKAPSPLRVASAV